MLGGTSPLDLEICVPASGVRSVLLCGAMTALRDRRVVPNIVSAVSGGAWAAYSALTRNDANALTFVKAARNLMLTRPVRRFLPPYHGPELPEPLATYSRADTATPADMRALGVQEFNVGFTRLPTFRFVVHDVLRLATVQEVHKVLWQSSTIPFVTHHGLHCAGGVDGGLRHLVFSSRRVCRERWLLTYWPWRCRSSVLERWRVDRVIHLHSRIRSAMYASDAVLDEAFALGFEQGMRLAV